MRGHRLAVATSGVLTVVVLALLGRLVAVHRTTWDWRLSPAAAPTKLQLDGRDYLRGGREWSRPADLREVGRSAGGGLILTTGDWTGTPTAVYVQVGAELTGYALMGGP